MEYGKNRAADKPVKTPPPPILDELLLPILEDLPLPSNVADFLIAGAFTPDKHGRIDRSKTLYQSGIALFNAGLSEQETFSVLANNDFVMDVALSHRANEKRALEYLWVEHCLNAKSKSSSVNDLDNLDVSDELDELDVSDGTVPSIFYDYDMEALAPVEYVIDGFIRNKITTIAGAAGVGKTSLLVPLAAAVAHLYQSPLNPELRRKVVYLAEEPEQVSRCLFGLRKTGGSAPISEFKEWFKIVPSKRRSPAVLGKLVKRLVKTESVLHNGYTVGPLIIIDTSSANIDLDNENDNSQASRAVSAIRENLGNAACWVVCHTAKSLKRADVSDLSARGAGAFGGDVNATAFIFSEDALPNKRFMALDKKRFESEFTEIEFETETGEEIVNTPWGGEQKVIYRVGMPAPSSPGDRIRAREIAAESQIENAEKLKKERIRDEILKTLLVCGDMSKTKLIDIVAGKKSLRRDVVNEMLDDGLLELSNEVKYGRSLITLNGFI